MSRDMNAENETGYYVNTLVVVAANGMTVLDAVKASPYREPKYGGAWMVKTHTVRKPVFLSQCRPARAVDLREVADDLDYAVSQGDNQPPRLGAAIRINSARMHGGAT